MEDEETRGIKIDMPRKHRLSNKTLTIDNITYTKTDPLPKSNGMPNDEQWVHVNAKGYIIEAGELPSIINIKNNGAQWYEDSHATWKVSDTKSGKYILRAKPRHKYNPKVEWEEMDSDDPTIPPYVKEWYDSAYEPPEEEETLIEKWFE